MKIPAPLMKEVFEKSGPCNEKIREVYQAWYKAHGFTPAVKYGFTYWEHPDGTYVKVHAKGGVEIVYPDEPT